MFKVTSEIDLFQLLILNEGSLCLIWSGVNMQTLNSTSGVQSGP